MNKCKMIGKIHSLESFGTVDGPGIRFVVFMQGCPLRCKYCHNPDSWAFGGGIEMEVSDIIEKIKRNIAFYKNGGITVSGGEPLLQKDFVTELFKEAKKLNLHTALDTSGALFDEKHKEDFKPLLSVTDLVLLDIKHISGEKHLNLCGFDNKNTLNFAKFLSEIKIKTQIRYVLVPRITDNEEDLLALGKFLGTLDNLVGLEVLPYHTLGVKKYDTLGIPYPLKDVPAATKEAAQNARKIILNAIKK